jgi:hypothetical protein
MRGFMHEAWRRLGTATPPFFIKLQLLGGAIGGAGTALSIITFPGSWHWASQIGPVLTGVGGTLVVVLQFVEKAQSILLPGQVLHNDTGAPVTVVVNPVAKDQIVTAPVASGDVTAIVLPVPPSQIITHTVTGGQVS